MKHIRMSVAAVATLLPFADTTSSAATYHKSRTPEILSEWHDSADSQLSVCLTVNRTTFSPSGTIVIRCAVRNNTEQPFLILRPFGDRIHAFQNGLHILGPGGEIKYQGAIRQYVLGTGAFHELKPGMVIDETLKIPGKYFTGLDEPGLYRIGYRYQTSGYPGKQKPDNLWEGRVRSSVIHVLVMDKKSDRPNVPAENSGAVCCRRACCRTFTMSHLQGAAGSISERDTHERSQDLPRGMEQTIRFSCTTLRQSCQSPFENVIHTTLPELPDGNRRIHFGWPAGTGSQIEPDGICGNPDKLTSASNEPCTAIAAAVTACRHPVFAADVDVLARAIANDEIKHFESAQPFEQPFSQAEHQHRFPSHPVCRF